MTYSRREFGRLALAGLPAAAFMARGGTIFGAFTGQTSAKPNSLIDGVQIGTITYSYRSMPDQSGEATLKYILESGISAVELMDGPAENFAGAPSARAGGAGGGGARGRGAAGDRADAPPPQFDSSWNGQPCNAAPRGDAPRASAAGAAGGRRGQATPEQQAAQEERARTLREWRTSVSMDRFKQLRKMYNDAGVTIYAYKSDGMQKNMQTTDGELDYLFNVAKTLGATHTTMELPSGADAEAMLTRMARFAAKHQLPVAYHTHTQGSMTAFDRAFAISKWNKSNVDLGHYVAGGNIGGSTLAFLAKHHDRVASVHLKDRTTPEHCALNLPFGTGETPIKDILQAIRKNKWRFPVSIELEYAIPQGSDAVQEVKKCVEYCRRALA